MIDDNPPEFYNKFLVAKIRHQIDVCVRDYLNVNTDEDRATIARYHAALIEANLASHEKIQKYTRL